MGPGSRLRHGFDGQVRIPAEALAKAGLPRFRSAPGTTAMHFPDDPRLAISTSTLVDWARAFVRHPSPQTELFEREPQVQSFIAERIVPLVQKSPCHGDAMAWAMSWSSLALSAPTEA